MSNYQSLRSFRISTDINHGWGLRESRVLQETFAPEGPGTQLKLAKVKYSLYSNVRQRQTIVFREVIFLNQKEKFYKDPYDCLNYINEDTFNQLEHSLKDKDITVIITNYKGRICPVTICKEISFIDLNEFLKFKKKCINTDFIVFTMLDNEGQSIKSLPLKNIEPIFFLEDKATINGLYKEKKVDWNSGSLGNSAETNYEVYVNDFYKQSIILMDTIMSNNNKHLPDTSDVINRITNEFYDKIVKEFNKNIPITLVAETYGGYAIVRIYRNTYCKTFKQFVDIFKPDDGQYCFYDVRDKEGNQIIEECIAITSCFNKS